MEYTPIEEWSDKQRVDYAWVKIKQAVDNQDIHMVRKMYHLIQWIQNGKQTYKKKK